MNALITPALRNLLAIIVPSYKWTSRAGGRKLLPADVDDHGRAFHFQSIRLHWDATLDKLIMGGPSPDHLGTTRYTCGP